MNNVLDFIKPSVLERDRINEVVVLKKRNSLRPKSSVDRKKNINLINRIFTPKS